LRSLWRGRVRAARSGVAHRSSPAAKRTMSSVPLPSESEEQAPDHQRYALLDMCAEEPFDALTRLARQLADTPMAFISIHDGERQRFKSRVGFKQGQNLDEPWPVLYEFAGRRSIVCADLQLDARFAGLPCVVGVPQLRFYHAIALATPRGTVVGALAVMDAVARTLSAEQAEALSVLARQVVVQFELRLAKKHLDEMQTYTNEMAQRLEADRMLEVQSLAADLHDGVGQELAALSMQMGSFLLSPQAQSSAVREPLEKMSEYLRNCMKSCRRIAEGHGGFMIRDLTLLEALKRSTQSMATGSIQLEFTGSGHSLSALNETTAYHLFRIGYEAIRNACTHSGCSRVKISCDSDDAHIDLIIEDDGSMPVNLDRPNTGIGRSVMSYRAHSIGAELHFLPLTQGGLRVECRLPRFRS
jgi:signal transduction histidine kinase